MADQAELLAHHYEQALELARAAGEADDAEALLEPTRRFLGLAAERALRLDVVAADGYFERALRLYEPDDLGRARILLHRSPTAPKSTGEVAEDLEEALRIFRLHGDDLAVGEALNLLSKIEWLRGRGLEADARLHESIELLERHPPSVELARGYSRMAGRMMIAGRSRECLEWAERAIDLYRMLGAEAFAAVTRNMRGCARCELDDPRGLDDLRESLTELIRSGQIDQAASAYSNVGNWVWMLEGPEPGLAVHREAEEFDVRRGLRGPAAWIRAEMTWMLYDLGRWDEILPIVGEVAAFDETVGGVQQLLVAPSRRDRSSPAWRGRPRGASPRFVPRARPRRRRTRRSLHCARAARVRGGRA